MPSLWQTDPFEWFHGVNKMITQFKQNQIVYVEMKRRREIGMG